MKSLKLHSPWAHDVFCENSKLNLVFLAPNMCREMLWNFYNERIKILVKWLLYNVQIVIYEII